MTEGVPFRGLFFMSRWLGKLWNQSENAVTSICLIIRKSKDLQVVDRKYHTLDGIQTDGLKRGVNIVRLQYEDGTFETKKVVVK